MSTPKVWPRCRVCNSTALCQHKTHAYFSPKDQRESEINQMRAKLLLASKWLHAAYDRPPQTPECIAMLAEIDAALKEQER